MRVLLELTRLKTINIKTQHQTQQFILLIQLKNNKDKFIISQECKALI
jgi:hypothetical protein